VRVSEAGGGVNTGNLAKKMSIKQYKILPLTIPPPLKN